jgi:hypothetical protein
MEVTNVEQWKCTIGSTSNWWRLSKHISTYY